MQVLLGFVYFRILKDPSLSFALSFIEKSTQKRTQVAKFRNSLQSNPIRHTGSSRKNEKSKIHSSGVYFHKILISTPVPGRKIATNYSPSPSRSLRNVLRLPSKVVPPSAGWLWELKKGLKTAKNWSLTRRNIRVGVKTEFLRNWDAKWALTQNVGSLGAVRAGKYPPAPPFWAPGAGFSISQRWRRSL